MLSTRRVKGTEWTLRVEAKTEAELQARPLIHQFSASVLDFLISSMLLISAFSFCEQRFNLRQYIKFSSFRQLSSIFVNLVNTSPNVSSASYMFIHFFDFLSFLQLQQFCNSHHFLRALEVLLISAIVSMLFNFCNVCQFLLFSSGSLFY